jgi:hypothetical protein
MNNNPTSAIVVTERVDDIPLLLTHIMQMGIAEKLDTHFPTHNNWIARKSFGCIYFKTTKIFYLFNKLY